MVVNCRKGEVFLLEFKLGDGAIVLPPLHITIIAIIIIIFLVRWSKQLETRRFTVFFYFLISTNIAPFYSQSTKEGSFQLWLPSGFLLVLFYLLISGRNHPSKMRACILGLCIALYRLILQYVDSSSHFTNGFI